MNCVTCVQLGGALQQVQEYLRSRGHTRTCRWDDEPGYCTCGLEWMQGVCANALARVAPAESLDPSGDRCPDCGSHGAQLDGEWTCNDCGKQFGAPTE